MHARIQFQKSDLFETLDKIDEPLKVLILVEFVPILQVRAQQRQCAAQVSDFMGNCRGGDAVGFQQLPQVLLFPVTHFLRRINHDGREARALRPEDGRNHV